MVVAVDGVVGASGRLAADIDEAPLVAALRAGDESAFRDLVQRYHTALVRLARARVASHAVAEEVAQDTWLAVIRGLAGFEGRSSLKTWIFRILVNQARKRGAGERRTIPMSSLGTSDEDAPVVDPERFEPEGQRWAGHWCAPPVPWTDLPAERLIGKETVAVVVSAIDELPDRQREVVTLRDVAGWTAAEVCDLLAISEGNQRVLLHRGRSRVRARLEHSLVEHRLGGKE